MSDEVTINVNGPIPESELGDKVRSTADAMHRDEQERGPLRFEEIPVPVTQWQYKVERSKPSQTHEPNT